MSETARPSPEVLVGTHVSLHADVAHRVTIEPVLASPDGEEWCWLMRPYVTEVAPTLPLTANLFMLTVFDLRDRFTNRTPPISDRLMGSRMRKSKQSVSDARKLLLEHPQRPLAHHGDGVYEPMPGRTWKQRRTSAVPDSSPALVRPGGRLSAVADNSASPYRETRAREIPELREVIVDDELVRLLTEGRAYRKGGAFSEKAARALLQRPKADRETVIIAVRNADALGQSGKIEKSWQAYVGRQIDRGCTLFAGIAAIDDQAQRNADTIARVADELGARGSEEYSALAAWWTSADARGRAGILTPAQRQEPAPEIWRRLCMLVSRTAGETQPAAAMPLPAPKSAGDQAKLAKWRAIRSQQSEPQPASARCAGVVVTSDQGV